MIVCEPMPAHATGVPTRGNFRHGDDSVIPHFRRITDACHEFGSVMIHQICRAQILDLLAWYEGQLQHHRVDLRLNTPMEADEVRAFAADAVVIATGSLPDASGFQRFGPMPGHIEGMHNANVWSARSLCAVPRTFRCAAP